MASPPVRFATTFRHPWALLGYLLTMGLAAGSFGRYLYLTEGVPLAWSVIGGWLFTGPLTFIIIQASVLLQDLLATLRGH